MEKGGGCNRKPRREELGERKKGTYWDFVKRDLRLEVNVITGRRKDAFHG